MNILELPPPGKNCDSLSEPLKDVSSVTTKEQYIELSREERNKFSRYDSPQSPKATRPRRFLSETSWFQKLPWSAIKKRDRSSFSVAQRTTLGDAEGAPKTRFPDTKRTSWMFIQTKPGVKNDAPGSIYASNPYGETPFDFELRSRQRQIEKQQVFTMTPISNRIPRPDSPSQSNQNRENSFRQVTEEEPNQRPSFLRKNAPPGNLTYQR